MTGRRALEDPSKLRRVLEATRLVYSPDELGDLLRHVIAEACSLTGARYGALAVFDTTGDGFAEFITVGLTPDQEARIGPRPQGKGLLGLLVADPRALLVDHLGDHPDSTAFPDGHPPMTSLLGVPLKVGAEVYGNLYLTDRRGGCPFDCDDLVLVESLALAAGMGIENARLHAALDLVSELQFDCRRGI